DGVALFANGGGNRRHWIDVRVRGEVDQRGGGRVNHLGVGSLIEVKAGSMYRARLVSEQVTHLGLGKHRQADVVRVVWTNGVPQAIVGPKPDQTLCEVHKTVEGSCPYVYAWNGEAFEFVTDLLWNAPLGLQIVEGVFAQPRAWEFLKIDGERLRPREGKYALQFTSELWEADYFDQVELIAVDHPADVQIFSNEKVGPAEIAQFQVHTVRQPRLPVAARNKLGEDVLPTIREADQVYLKGYTQIHRPGLADEHYLELDLGDLQGARQITLFLTGWIYPSDTSIRVGASQNPNWPQPKPPALAVPDSQGVWQEVRPFMGFPGGKPKTIAVDLSDAFLTDDFRLRIVTNWEIYWDHVFFTVDEEPAPLQLTTIPVAGADLHFRGFSAIRRRGLENPEHYDYGTVTTSPRWPPMFGRFTRYGDITSLLHQADDLLAILSPGDEMTLTFDVPSEPVPDGWKRDFLLHNVGWDKDAVLNTLYGQTVEPLPFQGMSGYPYGPDEAYPQTPRHLEYLRQYQTRTQSPARFWNWIRDHTPQTPALRP
ncbi:MAG: ASPIC/UnbV domain-containing protein, partial [Planctomycetales bacterium]